MSAYLDVCGCLTFWIASDGVSRDLLRQLLADAGVKHSVPRARQPLAALKRAIHESLEAGHWPMPTVRQRLLVRPLPKHKGYAFIHEQPSDGEKRLVHTQLGTVTFSFSEPDCSRECPLDFARSVREKYPVYLDLLTRSSLSDFLKSFLTQQFDAIGLRPSGGIYQFREAHYDAWTWWCERLNKCVLPGRAEMQVFTLKHEMDEQAAEAILQGVRREIRQRAAELREEVTGGKIGARGKASRKAEAYRLLAKVESVGSLLHESLPDLKRSLDEVVSIAGGLEILSAIEEHAV